MDVGFPLYRRPGTGDGEPVNASVTGLENEQQRAQLEAARRLAREARPNPLPPPELHIDEDARASLYEQTRARESAIEDALAERIADKVMKRLEKQVRDLLRPPGTTVKSPKTYPRIVG